MKLNDVLSKHQISIPMNGLSVHQDLSTSGEPTSVPNDQQVNSARDMETILDITRKINTSLVLSDVLALVVDHAIRITHAERGCVMLVDAENKLQRIISRDKNGNHVDSSKFQVSMSISDDVFKTGESICLESALEDERFEQRQSIIDLELQTVMCAPLMTHDATIGVIYVDSRFIQSVRKNEILRLFEILAGQAAIAIQNARLYENLQKTFDELKEANEHIIRSERMALRGELAAEVSHELNNVLGIVMLQTETLKRFLQQGDTRKSEKYAEEIGDSIRRIQTFAENLLVRASLKSELSSLDLNTLVKKLQFFARSLKKFRNGNIVLQLSEQLPEINGDRDQIQQVLLNLMNNAIEAFGQATITIESTYDAASNCVCLRIADNGPGLDPVVKEKMFREKITTKPDGHGFGLPVCKKIMDNHHGTIAVESETGKGTTFRLTFPV